MTTMVPLAQMTRRPPEAGRIRTGVKGARGAPKSIDTFRFTSPHRKAIERLAEMYGGTAKPWDDRDHKGQWEVITEANSIEVLAQDGGCTVWYEMWSGGGCQRRCDGFTCEIPSRDPNEATEDVPCICNAKGQADCKPTTRLNVMLPQLDFFGMWRLETKGWNAASELPGMFEMVVQLAEAGRMVRAHLNLEARTRKSGGQTRHFVVPTISVAASPDELLQGGGVARPQLTASGSVPPAAGELGTAHIEPEVVEAQVVDQDREMEIEASIRFIADEHKLDPDAVVATIWEQAGGDYAKLERFIDKNLEGKTLAWTQKGTLKWV